MWLGTQPEHKLSMSVRYNIPVRASWRSELSSDDKGRIERAIFLAIERAVKGAAEQGSTIVPADIQGAEGTSDRFESSRYRPDADTYSVPSYQNQGAPV